MDDRGGDLGVAERAAESGEDGAPGVGVAGGDPTGCHCAAPNSQMLAARLTSAAERADTEGAGVGIPVEALHALRRGAPGSLGRAER
eukprot:300938-Heterocapsa_arctica.AAC.2